MKYKFYSTLLFTVLISLSITAQCEQRLTPKIGYIDWGKNTVNVAGTDIEFKKGSAPPAGVEYGYIFGDTLFLGGELIFEDLDTTVGRYSNSNDINVYRLNAVMNYYFLSGDFFKPYVGIGLGYAKMGIHAAENATLQGYTYMGKLGFDMRFSSRLGLNLEYRNAYISVKDSSNNQFKSRNNEFYVGLNIFFGQ